MSRRRALGAGAAIARILGLSTRPGGYAPPPRVAPGTRRLVEAYGSDPRQVGEWWVPPGSASGTLPTVVLVHGGYWRTGFDKGLEDAVAADLSGRGYLVWNIDYRAADVGWPATITDVAAGYDHLLTGALADRVNPERIATVGHSAGGHLALWLASRGSLPAHAPAGPTPAGVPMPALVVAQAPVASLVTAANLGLGAGAVSALLGGAPAQEPERYALTDPAALLPTGVRVVCVHGTGDDVVPISQSEEYVRLATEAGDDAELVRVRGGHFEHLDPTTAAIDALRAALATLA